MDRLSVFLTLMTGAVLTGGLAITFFTFGYYTWQAIAISAAVGFLLAWPAAYLVSRRIKRKDPEFDHTKRHDYTIPDPNAREV